MGLLQNYTVLNAEPLKYMGGAGAQCIDRAHHNRPEANNNQMIGEGSFSQKSGVPDGYAPPYQFAMPIKDGGMSSRNAIIGIGEATDTTYLATVGAMASRTTPKMGSGTISAAPLSLLVQLLLNAGGLTGFGEVASSLMKALANMGASVAGVGSIYDQSALNIIAWMAGDIIASGTLDGSTMKGWADLAAEISSQGDVVTPQTVAAAVWNALAVTYNDAGTMGNKLNSAAVGGVDYDALATAVWTRITRTTTDPVPPAASDIWQYMIENDFTAQDFLRILGAVLAGELRGAESGTLIFTNVSGTNDVVEADTDQYGNRISIAIDTDY